MTGLNRVPARRPEGLLRVDKKKIANEANPDGKYLLRCSEPALPAEDIALGHTQLLQVERGWRDMKTTPGAPPGLSPPRRPHPRARGTLRQRAELTTAQRDILDKLGVDAPQKIIEPGPAQATP